MRSSSDATLIKTKLMAPLERPNFIKRAALLDQFQAAANRKLLLVSAPEGFGKTTILGQWFHTLDQGENLLAWLTVSDNDNDPELFLRYLIASLQTANASIGKETLEKINLRSIEDISDTLGSLVNDITLLSQELYLFLDDFHTVKSETITHFVELLINLSPSNFHLIIAGRHTPDLSLANLRVAGDLTQISVDNLRFDTKESKHFLKHVHGLDLDDNWHSALNQRCEGWAAALQLASLSLKDSNAKERFIEDFSGTSKDVADYLTLAVLDRQPLQIQRFLNVTAILDRLNAEICNELLDTDDAREIIQGLEEEHLFIMPLGADRIWYRYHNLFRDYLLAKLEREQSENINLLLAKASNWFEKNGYPAEAVNYALRAKDISRAAELIIVQAEDEFIRGKMSQVSSWIKRIPIEYQLEHPRLMILHAISLFHMNMVSETLAICDQLEKELDSYPEETQAQVKSTLIMLHRCISTALDNAADVIKFFPSVDDPYKNFMEVMTNNIQGYSYFVLGNFKEARKHLDIARKVNPRHRSGFGLTYTDCFIGMIEIAQGELYRARAVFEYSKAFQSDHHTNPNIQSAKNTILNAIDYEMNEQSQTLEEMQAGLNQVEQAGHISLIQLGYITFAKFLAKENNVKLALSVLDKLQHAYPSGFSNEYHNLRIANLQVELLVRAKRHKDALRKAASVNIDIDENPLEITDKWTRETYLRQLIYVRLALEIQPQKDLTKLLSATVRVLKEKGLGYAAVESLIMLSRAYWQVNDSGTALKTMREALKIASKNNILRLFVNDGKNIVHILRKLQKDFVDQDPLIFDFLNEILMALQPENAEKQQTLPTRAKPTMLLIEPLSSREKDVLALMAEGKPNSIIAETLNISENTVKWHSRNLFGKINVRNRTEAVITAQEMGLLSSS